MNYSEKASSGARPVLSFLLIIAAMILVALAFKFTAKLPFSAIIQLVLFVGVTLGLYYLIKYLFTPHEYAFDGEELRIYRGEGSKRKLLAVLTEDMITSVRPCADAPSGPATEINACSSFSARKKTGYCISCSDGTESFRLYFGPSEKLLGLLKDEFSEKFTVSGR